MQAGTLFLGVKNQRKIYVLFQAVINRLHQMVATLLLGRCDTRLLEGVVAIPLNGEREPSVPPDESRDLNKEQS